MAAKINFGSNEEFIKNYKELKSSRKWQSFMDAVKVLSLNTLRK